VAIKMMLASALGMAMQMRIVSETPPSTVHTDMDDLRWVDAPIEPSWITSGNPVARKAPHSAATDGGAATALWDCTSGEFRWYFGWDETVVIVDGEVEVTFDDGKTQMLRKGSICYFAAGTWAKWRVETYVRKIAFLRRKMPKPLAAIYDLKRMLTGQYGTGL